MCMLYVRMHAGEVRLGCFPDRAAAERYYELWINGLSSSGAPYPSPIYVEYGRRMRR